LGTSTNPQFEVICDGDTTRITVSLLTDKSFDVRNIRFPDRLVVDLPTMVNLPKKSTVHFDQTSRERLPIGIITYVSVFESQDSAGYSRLVFEADRRFTYKTSIENNALNIDIRPSPSKPKENLATTKDETTVVAASTPTSTTETESTQETSNTESTTGNTQTFAPTDKSSFMIKDKEQTTDETGHTTPESSTGLNFQLKDVTTEGDTQTVSVKDMIGTLPEFAKSNIISGGNALEGEEGELKASDTIASEPLMIEPPEEFKPLPKGSRPAADPVPDQGESVILPVKGLVRASVGDPEVLVVNVLSQEELLITAKGFGQTTLITWKRVSAEVSDGQCRIKLNIKDNRTRTGN